MFHRFCVTNATNFYTFSFYFSLVRGKHEISLHLRSSPRPLALPLYSFVRTSHPITRNLWSFACPSHSFSRGLRTFFPSQHSTSSLVLRPPALVVRSYSLTLSTCLLALRSYSLAIRSRSQSGASNFFTCLCSRWLANFIRSLLLRSPSLAFALPCSLFAVVHAHSRCFDVCYHGSAFPCLLKTSREC